MNPTPDRTAAYHSWKTKHGSHKTPRGRECCGVGWRRINELFGMGSGQMYRRRIFRNSDAFG